MATIQQSIDTRFPFIPTHALELDLMEENGVELKT